ncbi:MAG: hypothetical protein HN392_03230 [Anaerolineae bacterium]|jgi:hypothetical protein|nr:hypothetical protein [Anaerolineae bacterium]MBT7073366.1 hypothetical protein [Anaerolineae bacterium]MBT7781661.1 hypothetical protein [Anaerolineae bacterium]
MKTQIIQLEPHDDHISIRDKMNWSKTPRILLILPRRRKFDLNALDLKLLQRHARSLGAELGLVTKSSKIIRAATALNIPFFSSNLAAQHEIWTPQKHQGYKRRKAPQNLRSLRQSFRSDEAKWRTHPASRLGFFSLSTFALLALVFAFIPQAKIVIEPERRVQSLIIPVRANLEVEDVFISGSIPAYELSADLTHQRSLAASGRIQIPVEVASGSVTFRNLTDLAIQIPAGTVLRSIADQEIRFETLKDAEVEGIVDATVEIPVKSLVFGERGNLAPNLLEAIEGELSLWLAVTNPAPTSGGGDEFVNAPSERDHEELYELTLSYFNKESEEEILKELAEGDLIFPDTISEIQILEAIYAPLAGETGDRLTLTMHVVFQLLYTKEVDMAELAQSALSASVSPDFTAMPDSLFFSQIGEFENTQPGVTAWQMRVEQELRPNITSAQIAALTQGRSTQKAIENLQGNINLATEPKITISPAWWKWLPISPFRINLVIK